MYSSCKGRDLDKSKIILDIKVLNFSLEEGLSFHGLLSLSVQSAVEVEGGAAAGEGDHNSGSWLVENSGVDVVGNSSNCVDLSVQQVVLGEALNGGEVHAPGLVNGVVAWVVGVGAGEEVSDPPVENVSALVGNADLSGGNGGTSEGDGCKESSRNNFVHLNY